MQKYLSIAMLDATGAVGNHAAQTLAQLPGMQRLTLLGRRPADNITGSFVAQHAVDIVQPASYEALLPGHTTATTRPQHGHLYAGCGRAVLLKAMPFLDHALG